MLILKLLQPLLLLVMVQCRNRSACRHGDRRRWCSQIGSERPLSTCYRHYRRCCDTCTRLKSSQPDCPFGDRDPAKCAKLGKSTPLTACYTNYNECCQTCQNLKLNIPGCAYGDKRPSCDRIGSVYLVSACYSREAECCQTCHRLKNHIPGCQFGDRETWCGLIGQSWPESMCLKSETWNSCCGTCIRLGLGLVTLKHSTTLPTPHVSKVNMPTTPDNKRSTRAHNHQRRRTSTPVQSMAGSVLHTTSSVSFAEERQTPGASKVGHSINLTPKHGSPGTKASVTAKQGSDTHSVLPNNDFNVSATKFTPSNPKPKHVKPGDSNGSSGDSRVNSGPQGELLTLKWMHVSDTTFSVRTVTQTTPKNKPKNKNTKTPSHQQGNEILKGQPGETGYSSWNRGCSAKWEFSCLVLVLFHVLVTTFTT